jgi:NAD(P) transhydrogenase
MTSYDLAVIGSGPGGQRAAVAAAKLGYRVAVIERRRELGGVCVHTGTIPSKTIREAVLYLSGLRPRAFYGSSYRVKRDVTVADLALPTRQVVDREAEVVRDQLTRNLVDVLTGTASFVDPHTLQVRDEASGRRITAEKIVIACGTRPARPASVAFDGRHVVDSDELLHLDRLPRSTVVVGAGVIGLEYASILAALGVEVTVVERRDRMLEFVDVEVVEALQYHLRELGVVLRLGEHVEAVETHPSGALCKLQSGKVIAAGTVLYSAGRQGATDSLELGNAGLEADERGRIAVDEHYRTAVDHIYAVGDVIGFPALAATSMDQGRLAAHHALGEPAHSMPALVPIGIYTIPEISYVGQTEGDLTAAAVPYEVGVARYRELARGQIMGDTQGLLKLLVHQVDRTLLGVHIFGSNATELVHIGQAVMGGGATVDYLLDAVFNYPTLAEAYKVAALDAANRLRAVERVTTVRAA